ncbi:MAG: hypothetical protein O3B95_11220, partial [Chloroflexi bacterium]|nr:hypothetical protein [Chloroflexota bacterium]
MHRSIRCGVNLVNVRNGPPLESVPSRGFMVIVRDIGDQLNSSEVPTSPPKTIIGNCQTAGG